MIRRLVERRELGQSILNDEWAGKGRPPRISNAEVDEIVRECEMKGGKIFEKKDVVMRFCAS